MKSENKSAKTPSRLYFLDNMRTLLVFLVILLHAAGPYMVGDSWAWFWIADDPSNNNISGIIFLLLDVFIMSAIFFISGVLAPKSLASKTGKKFILGKLKRLMLPWLMAVLTLIPLYKVIFLASRGLPQEHWSTYSHLTNPNSQNWLWFLPVLFLFNLLFLAIDKANLRLPSLSPKFAVFLTFLIGVVFTLSMDLLNLKGWTLTPLIDFQNERILIYFLYFLLGAFFSKRNTFASAPAGKKLYLVVNSVSWLPMNIYIFTILWPLVFNPGSFLFSRIIDRTIVAITFHLTLLMLVYTLVETFRRYGNNAGRVWQEVNKNTYYVYIVHVIVTGLATIALRPLGIPSIVKHLINAVVTFIVSNLAAFALRRLIASAARLFTTKQNKSIKKASI